MRRIRRQERQSGFKHSRVISALEISLQLFKQSSQSLDAEFPGLEIFDYLLEIDAGRHRVSSEVELTAGSLGIVPLLRRHVEQGRHISVSKARGLGLAVLGERRAVRVGKNEKSDAFFDSVLHLLHSVFHRVDHEIVLHYHFCLSAVLLRLSQSRFEASAIFQFKAQI